MEKERTSIIFDKWLTWRAIYFLNLLWSSKQTDSCSVLRNTVLNTIQISRKRQQWEENHSPQADKSNKNWEKSLDGVWLKERGLCINNEKAKHFCVPLTLGTFMPQLLIFIKTDFNLFFLLCEGYIYNAVINYFYVHIWSFKLAPKMYQS